MLKTRVSPFEFTILKRLKSLDINWESQRLLVASSAGRDSLVLLNVLTALQSRLKFDLVVAHVHHGNSSDKKVTAYRKKAAASAKKQAIERGHQFILLKHQGEELTNEADFRKVREKLLADACEAEGCDRITFAHHSDDLLETRLIRLIRGTGAQGLRAMGFSHGKKLRPLLDKTSLELQSYAELEKLSWLEDPTNSQDRYFRNWLRNVWLPQLEVKRAGSRQSFARSLENLASILSQEPQTPTSAVEVRPEIIKRKEFAALTSTQKREVLARIMLNRGARDFSRRQIDEILKRLSSHRGVNRRKMSFEVGGLHWLVNAEQIEAVRL